MASPMQRLADALAFLSPQRKAAVLRAANENPALYAKLMQATEADDFNKTLRMVVANDAGQWGAAPARPAPVRPEAPAALTTAQRMMRDPNIRPAIDANLDRLPPELAERIAADDPDAFMEAFQMITEAEGELPPVRSIGEPLGDDPAMLRQAHSAMRDGYPVPFDSMAEEVMDPAVLREFSPAQQELMRELEANGWLGFDYPSQAANAVLSADAGNFEMSPSLLRARSALIGGQAPPPATRQMELPLGGDNELPSRGLIPFGVRGEGVPVGGPSGMGAIVGEPVSAGVPIFPMTNFERALANPARQRWAGFGFPSQYGPARIGTTAGTRPSGPPPARGVIQHPSMGGPRDMIVRQPERMGLGDIAAAGIAGAAAGGGGFLMGRGIGEELFNQDAAPETQVMGEDLPVTPDDTVDLTTAGTADLAAETAPPPQVAPQAPDANAWRRVIDEGYIPLGDATQAEIEAGNARIRNMVRMGATWHDARARVNDDIAKAVVARAKQKAEAFLQANPGF